MKKSTLSLVMFMFVFFLTAQNKYPTVVIETNYGTMKAILYDDTPNHSDNFIKLINRQYFDGTLFHRVLKEFMIQGGAQDSKNAPAGAQVGGGRTDMDIMPEFKAHHFHKKGALAAPRRDDSVNPQKKSDGSQFFIVHGKVLTEGRIDTLERAVNVPIKNKIVREHYSPYRDKLAELKAIDVSAFNSLLDSVLHVVDSLYEAAPGKFFFPEDMREAYTTVGGARHLDGEYTVFGEVIEGLEVIDKIANLPIDHYERPTTDVKIIRIYTQQ